jgi:hypothetical protein
MSKKLFHGSCHCGKIKFQALIDLSEASGKCNCTMCTKNAIWKITVPPNDFKLLQGKDDLTRYSNDPQIGEYFFCKNCGTTPYHFIHKTEWSEESVGIKLNCLDDVSVEELASMPVVCTDGKAGTWAIITDPEIIKTLY